MGHAIWRKVISSETLNGVGTTVESAAIDIGDGKSFGVKLIVESGTTPRVKLNYQVIESRQGQESKVGTAEVGENGMSWTTPVSDPTIFAALNAVGNLADGFVFMVSKFIRLQAIGNASNGADTVVSAWICQYSESK